MTGRWSVVAFLVPFVVIVFGRTAAAQTRDTPIPSRAPLGGLVASAGSILVLAVEGVDRSETVTYRVERVVKGEAGKATLRHATSRSAGWDTDGLLTWAEPGRRAVAFVLGDDTLVCPGDFWYLVEGRGGVGECEPLPDEGEVYAGSAERLEGLVADLLAGRAVFVPVRAIGPATLRPFPVPIYRDWPRGKRGPVTWRRDAPGGVANWPVWLRPEPARRPGPTTPEERAGWRGQLRDASPLRRARAVEKLAAAPSAEDLAALRGCAEDRDPFVRLAVAEAVARSAVGPLDLGPFSRALADPDRRLRMAALAALVALAPRSFGAIPALLGVAREDEPDLRAAALYALGKIVPSVPRSEAVRLRLAEALATRLGTESDRRARYWCAWALLQLGGDAWPAAEVLSRFRWRERGTTSAVVTLLHRFDPPPCPTLIESLLWPASFLGSAGTGPADERCRAVADREALRACAEGAGLDTARGAWSAQALTWIDPGVVPASCVDTWIGRTRGDSRLYYSEDSWRCLGRVRDVSAPARQAVADLFRPGNEAAFLDAVGGLFQTPVRREAHDHLARLAASGGDGVHSALGLLVESGPMPDGAIPACWRLAVEEGHYADLGRVALFQRAHAVRAARPGRLTGHTALLALEAIRFWAYPTIDRLPSGPGWQELEREAVHVRQAALDLRLAITRTGEPGRPLAEALADPDDLRRFAAALALCLLEVRDPDPTPELRRALATAPHRVAYLARLVPDLPAWTRPALRPLLTSPHEGSYDLARRNLERLAPADVAEVWSVLPTAPPRPADLEALWTGLSGPDPTTAYRAFAAFAATPADGVAFLRERVRPVPVVPAERIAGWIADLDDDAFAVRERATAALADLPDSAGPVLRAALAARPTPEVRRRLVDLLERRQLTLSEDQRRRYFAVELLRRYGTPEASRLLRDLAEGHPDAATTRHARLVLAAR